MNHLIFIRIVISAYTFAILALLADSVKNIHTVEKYLGVSSATIWIIFLLFCFILTQRKYLFPKILQTINTFFILPVSSVLSIGLTVIDFNTPDNFIYAQTHINYQQLGIMAIGSFFFFMMTSATKWSGLMKKFVISSLPAVLFATFSLMMMWPFDYFVQASKEDHLIEWVQFIILIMVGIKTLTVSFLLKKSYPWLAVFYLVLSVGLFVVAGDEISWGQRVFSFQTPEQIAQNNIQNEITIHNLNSISKFVWQGYFAVSLYGSFAWLFKRFLINNFPKVKVLTDILIPPWYVASFFFFSLIYQYHTRPGAGHSLWQWSEATELVLYFGIAFSIWSTYPFIKNNTHSKQKK